MKDCVVGNAQMFDANWHLACVIYVYVAYFICFGDDPKLVNDGCVWMQTQKQGSTKQGDVFDGRRG